MTNEKKHKRPNTVWNSSKMPPIWFLKRATASNKPPTVWAIVKRPGTLGSGGEQADYPWLGGEKAKLESRGSR
jgi:hypothetical protein